MNRQSRRHFLQGGLAVAGLGLLSGCGILPSRAQRPEQVPRIGYLAYGRSGPDPREHAFQQGLRELGYVEGANLAIEWRFTDQSEALPGLAAELVRLDVAVIVTAGTQAADAARAATGAIPIVMPVSGDPVGQGFVSSLSRPGACCVLLVAALVEISSNRHRKCQAVDISRRGMADVLS